MSFYKQPKKQQKHKHKQETKAEPHKARDQNRNHEHLEWSKIETRSNKPMNLGGKPTNPSSEPKQQTHEHNGKHTNPTANP